MLQKYFFFAKLKKMILMKVLYIWKKDWKEFDFYDTLLVSILFAPKCRFL